ncbi:ABC transporter substrate-binding protein [Clostridium beijerinckii]|uniref:ABC transporter substrate-binding protein n=1 Tax=Clostridium beijerinckii TaxID=1520 RepID=UPI00149433CD|nr:sugar ABC transporter substrate-binding protein [Clostridium beijerinckii]NOW05155.1 multiple sugar transport system substrate-binding protein [Clostridium beijerinckii]NYC01703.1 multiple sugar transport system substrate-binding protein [Clostridium beijerinckii]
MKKKIISLILTSILSVTGLVGCGNSANPVSGQDGAKTSGGEPVHITYGIWDSNQEKGLRKMADDFESKNPGIKIDIQVTGWTDYWTMLEAAATGGSLPDTFWMHSNEIYKYASNGMLLDLTDKISKSSEVKLSNYPEGLVKIYNLENKQYAVPKDYDTIGLWYNKAMFDKAGLSYPDETWNWDKLYEAAKKLTTGDGKQYGFLAGLADQEGFYNFIYQNGGTVITDDKVSGYDNPKTIEAMKYYMRFVSEGLSPKIYDDAARGEAMQNGLCAMGVFGSWNLTAFSSNEYMAKNFNVTVLPSANDGKRVSIFNGLGNAISANTKHPEEAWKWVEYLSSKEGQTKQAELGVAISAYNGTADAWVNSNKTFNIKSFIDMVKYAQIVPYSNTTKKWEDKSFELLKIAYNGQKPVEDSCKETAKMMNDILKEEK